ADEDRQAHPRVPRVSTQPAGQNDETRVIERGDRHEPAVPDRLTDSEPEREEAGDEGGGQGRGGRERRDEHRADEGTPLPAAWGPPPPSASVFVSTWARRRWVRPMCRETARARMEARVMTPSPPTMIPTMMTPCPKVDQ